MPCRDDYPPDYSHLEPLLCEAMELIEQSGQLKKCSKELRAWYKCHEEGERERVKREALAKLSPREKRALGLD